MRKHVIMFMAVAVLALGLVRNIKAQELQQVTQTFLDSTAFGIRIQVNATGEVRPTENATIVLALTNQTEVYVTYFNLSVFGFLNGTTRILMANASEADFSLTNSSRTFNYTFVVPEWVWGATYGEIKLGHSAKYGPVIVQNEGFVFGFSMTNVRNVFLEGLEHNFADLRQMYEQLNDTYVELNRTYVELNRTYVDLAQNFSTLQGTVSDLDNTRRVAAVFGITTVIFVATTLYFVLRKPREYW